MSCRRVTAPRGGAWQFDNAAELRRHWRRFHGDLRTVYDCTASRTRSILARMLDEDEEWAGESSPPGLWVH